MKAGSPGIGANGDRGGGINGDNFFDNRYPKTAAGYTFMCSKAASCTQGGVAFVWKEDNLNFNVELVLFNDPNTLTF